MALRCLLEDDSTHFICAYSQELPAEIVMDPRRTHPILRTAEGARPSAHYSEPAAFVRGLER
jgi:hypothetical protein